jgi:hypothetical protein
MADPAPFDWKPYVEKVLMVGLSALIAFLASRGFLPPQQPTAVQVIQAPNDPTAAAAFGAAIQSVK